MLWSSRLRNCTTSWKVAGSLPDCVIEIFYWNPSGRTMVLGLTEPLTEMSTRNISWGFRRPVQRADKITTFMCRLSWNMRTSNSWIPQGLSRPVMGLLYLFNLISDTLDYRNVFASLAAKFYYFSCIVVLWRYALQKCNYVTHYNNTGCK